MNNLSSRGKVQRGDRLRIPAEWYNAVTDMLRGNLTYSDTGNPRDTIHPALTVKVQNNTGGYLPNFSVLGLYEPIANQNVLDIPKHPVLSGDLPLEDCPIGILQQPLNDGDIGKAIISGITLARVLVNSDSHKWVKHIADNSEYLETSENGIGKVIQYFETGSVGGSLADADSGDSAATELALIQLIGTKEITSSGGSGDGRVSQSATFSHFGTGSISDNTWTDLTQSGTITLAEDTGKWLLILQVTSIFVLDNSVAPEQGVLPDASNHYVAYSFDPPGSTEHIKHGWTTYGQRFNMTSSLAIIVDTTGAGSDVNYNAQIYRKTPPATFSYSHSECSGNILAIPIN